MNVSIKVLYQILFQLYHKIARTYGFLPFVLDSRFNKFVPAHRRLSIYSNCALLFQVSMAAISISMDKSVIAGFQNLNQTVEFVELMTSFAFYGLMFVTPLTAFLGRNQILNTMNKFIVLNRYCRVLNGHILLPSKIIRRLYWKLTIDIISTLIIAAFTVFCSAYENSSKILVSLYLLFSVPIFGFSSDVFSSSFYFYGHLIESVVNAFKNERKKMRCGIYGLCKGINRNQWHFSET